MKRKKGVYSSQVAHPAGAGPSSLSMKQQGVSLLSPWMGCQSIASLQRHNFGQRALHVFLTKIMATIFDFYGSRKLVRERHLYQEDG